jgi:membrane protease YdiL (CAAX protease family)
VLIRTLVGWGALFLLVAGLNPDLLFIFPRERPGLWVAVMIGYPLLSAFPQEFIFRTFFFQRYASLITDTRARIAVSAVLFGYAHIVLHNLPAVVLSTVGGLLFASTYARTRSTVLAAFEHALYGCFVFSVGLGSLFYAGGRSLSATFRLGG